MTKPLLVVFVDENKCSVKEYLLCIWKLTGIDFTLMQIDNVVIRI